MQKAIENSNGHPQRMAAHHRDRDPSHLGEEAPVPFVADLGKGTGRCREQVRDQEQIAHGRPPLYLRGVADEFSRKAAVDWVVVPDRDPLVLASPDDFERHHTWLWS